MRIKILRSANAKYHFIFTFFCNIKKGDLRLMYSRVFWCEFIDLVGFFGSYCDPCHSLHNMKGHTRRVSLGHLWCKQSVCYLES